MARLTQKIIEFPSPRPDQEKKPEGAHDQDSCVVVRELDLREQGRWYGYSILTGPERSALVLISVKRLDHKETEVFFKECKELLKGGFIEPVYVMGLSQAGVYGIYYRDNSKGLNHLFKELDFILCGWQSAHKP